MGHVPQLVGAEASSTSTPRAARLSAQEPKVERWHKAQKDNDRLRPLQSMNSQYNFNNSCITYSQEYQITFQSTSVREPSVHMRVRVAFQCLMSRDARTQTHHPSHRGHNVFKTHGLPTMPTKLLQCICYLTGARQCQE